jgi:IS30 family transposase
VGSLTIAEREIISIALAMRLSLRTIATQISRSPSTVSREVKRNKGWDCYRAAAADGMAWRRPLRPKPCTLAGKLKLVGVISEKLQCESSPEQISGWLKREYSHDKSYHVSHETIYKSLFIQTRGVLEKELLACLRSRRVMRGSRHATRKGKGLGGIVDAVSIRERPASLEDRPVPGHWEGDSIAGSNNSHIATLVERHSRYVMLVKVKNSSTDTAIKALIKQSRKLPSELYKSLTWDRGSELAGHKKFTLATALQVYFCEPHSPWQRGSNENTNRLLRQYFPKGTDLKPHSQAQLDKVARRLNDRPRKTLDFETPAERFNACVASTG